ncbi:MAG TPA: 4Fe-4S dicluster domain-containing protein [Deltaproteobacteria bacterium]|nr:(2Fe-2S)-binding protein [Deltaproteobacteria bacterium]HDZ90101.1 4Fe-4S dicluster domain-containing protein [Deltaproteobacteria bacterium]
MKTVRFKIDGREIEAQEGISVLAAARSNGIRIPTLCYHSALKPIGACKLCGIEVKGRAGKWRILLSCILRVREGLEVRTQSKSVIKARTTAFRNLLSMAPQSKFIRNLAEEYNIDLGPTPDGCIRCRLCIRVCKEIVGAGALKMEKRNGISYVTPEEGLCIGCGTCVNLCPTDAIQMTDREGNRIISIRDETIGVHALERCEACGSYFASRKFIKHVSELTSTHTDLKEHHLFCPTCAKLFSNRVKSFSRIRRGE